MNGPTSESENKISTAFPWLETEAAGAAELAKAIRHDLHRHPELSGQEVLTAARVCEELDRLGIGYTVMDEIHAVVGLIPSGKPGKTVGLRADMDALPIQEETGLPFASEVPGVMHACGHDAHTAILLGAASVLVRHKADFSGNIKLFFQPAEESTGGALPMIQRGCLEDPHVDAVFGLHVSSGRPVSTVASRPGALNAGSDGIWIDIHGQSCHGAHPDAGTDAIWIAARIIDALYGLQARRVSPTEPLALNIGTVQGGTAKNIVCDHVRLGVTLRTIRKETHDRFFGEMVRLVEKTAESLGGRADVTVTASYLPLLNDPRLYDRFVRVARDVLGAKHVAEIAGPSMGSEDFAFFADRRPGVFFNLGTAPLCSHGPAHSSTFLVNEDGFAAGILMHCALALDYLN